MRFGEWRAELRVMNENSSSSLNSSSASAEGDDASASLKRSLRDRSAGAGTGIDVGAGGAATTNVTVAAAVPITRTGKIARLPQAIRQRLNERLADGRSSEKTPSASDSQPLAGNAPVNGSPE